MESLKQRMLNVIAAHPKVLTFGIGLAITVAIGIAIGMSDQSHTAYAYQPRTFVINS